VILPQGISSHAAMEIMQEKLVFNQWLGYLTLVE
jgi:hypothetical protein